MGYSPVSPLHLGAGVCDGIIAAARLGMAVQVLTNPVAGTTAPASLAGALAQQDAEILAGVVLAQAAAPGAACGYGARLSVADPRDGRLLCGAGQWALASVGATLLARRHGLACDCYGPDTSAPLVDVQAGYQQALPALAGALARPVHDVRHRRLGRRLHLPRAARRRRRRSTARRSTRSSRRRGTRTLSTSTR